MNILFFIIIYIYLNIYKVNSSLDLYNDQLNSEIVDVIQYNKHGLDLKNTEVKGSCKYSLKMDTQNYNSFKLQSKNGFYFDPSKFNYLSFWINSPIKNPPIQLQFHSTSLNNDTKKIPLVSSNYPSISASKKKEIPVNTWNKVLLAIPLDSHFNGVSFSSSTNHSIPIYIEKIVLETHSLAHIVEGNYHIRPAFADASLGGSNGGHAFSINSSVPNWALGGYTSWVFHQDRGILQVLSNGNIVLSGPIVPAKDSKSCHTWYVDLMFKPSQAPSSLHLDLSSKSYSPNGPIDTNGWKFYTPVTHINTWTATGCNHVDTLNLLTINNNIPIQLGYGANGKNGKLGISALLQYIDSNGHSSGSEYIDIHVDIYEF